MYLFCITAGIAYVLFIAIATMVFGGDDPFNEEHNLSEDFIRTNSVIRDHFGKPVKVTSNNYGGSCGQVKMHAGPDGGPQGWFRYDVIGSKSNGTIVVFWQGTAEGNFEVLSIEHFINGGTNGTLWKKEEISNEPGY